MDNKYLICKRCVSDLQFKILNLIIMVFVNIVKFYDEMEKEYPFDENSLNNLKKIAKNIKKENKNNKYDCVVGISGGRDSSYLLYVVKEILGLRPLAVHYDNGFDSETSTSNILNVCNKLNVELETKVADWDTFKKITKSFFLVSVSDPDTPTDIGIFKTMYQTAYDENISYVFNGHSFRTEGVEPLDWTYMDGLYVKEINKSMEKIILQNLIILH